MWRQFGDDVAAGQLAEQQSDVEDGVQPADLRAAPVHVSQLQFNTNASTTTITAIGTF